MAIALPKYQQQVGVSGASTAVQQQSAGQEFEAMAGFADTAGKVVGALGQQYIEKKQALKESADKADYEVRKRNFRQQLSDMETRALTVDGLGQDELEEKVYRPALEAFSAETQNQGYSPNSIGAINQDWGAEVSKIGVEFAAKQNKREIADYNQRQRSLAETLLLEGDVEGSNAIFTALEETTRPGEAQEWRSLANYNKETIDIQGLEEARLDGDIDDKQLLSGFEDIRSGLSDSDMNSRHRQAVEISINAKINNFKGRRVKGFEKVVSDIEKKIAEDDYTVEDSIILRQAAGDAFADAFDKTHEAKLLSLASSDSDAKKAVGYLNKFKDGDMAWSEVLRRVADIDGTVGALAVSTAGMYAQDVAKNSTQINAFELQFRDQKMNIRGYTPDFISEVSDYLNEMPDGQAEYLNDSMKHIAKWQKSNPDATLDEYNEMKRLYFGPQASNLSQAISTPQVNSLPIGTVQDGYKYIGGDRFSESSWEEL